MAVGREFSQSFSNRKQSGTALITVVLIAAVVIVLVVESVKTIRYQKQLSSNLINRDQAYSYLMGMEELAKIYLKKAFENETEDTVHLGQLWAQEDITFPIDGGGMTASIRDMQSCFNLNSLLKPGANNSNNNPPVPPNNNNGSIQPGQGQNPTPGTGNNNNAATREPPGKKIMEELIEKTKQDSSIIGKDLVSSMVDWMDEDIEPNGAGGAEDDHYQLLEVPYRTSNSLLAHESEMLTMRGYTRDVYFGLRPLVCVLPDENVSEINVNTVSEENATLLYAVLSSGNSGSNLTENDVKKAINERPEKGYESSTDFFTALGVGEIRNDSLIVTSKFFEMRAKAEIGNTRVEMKSLFQRDDDNNFKVISRYFGRE